jgi:tetratricopeptide (TPR) repeat protein/2-polyprenyl-3-methyl-5-hydroxy-6-metoxy-1,4-benzoquinol methylase
MELTLDQALQKAIESQKAGQLQDADRLYTAILQAQPDHPHANHNMGVLAMSIGKPQQALPFFTTALETDQSTLQFWLSYIDGLIRVDQISDAAAILEQAKAKGAAGETIDQLAQRINAKEEKPTETILQDKDANQIATNILDSLSLDQATKLARKKFKGDFFDEAKAIYEDILKRFPQNKSAIDGVKALLRKPSSGTADSQDPSDERLQPLIDYYNQGQLQKGLNGAAELLKKFPRSATLYNFLGAFYAGLQHFDEAIENYKQALVIEPDYGPAYSNMGNTLKDKGELDAAIDCCKKAIRIKPDNAHANHNLAIALDFKGDTAAAIESYRKAITINPDYTEAYFSIANCIKGKAFSKPIPGLLDIIGSLLERKNFVRPSEISGAGISLLKFEPVIKRLFKTHSADELKKSLTETITDLSKESLLLKLMSVSPINDIDLETVLTDIRSTLLLSTSDAQVSPEFLRFQSALALQCYTNEYIYYQTDTETTALKTLELSIEKAVAAGRQPNPQSVLCAASYKALHEYAWADLLIATTAIEEVYTRQFVEPKQEIDIKSEILTLEKVTNKVSSKVKEQYEEHPYPRWVSLALMPHPKSISEVTNELKLRLFDESIVEIESPNILIGGCGTGQHSIGTAKTFRGANVLAIDLSLTSLAYAKRKTIELGLSNVNYMHADILDLRKLDRQFDIVESSGVLHHMEEPMAGWKVLTDCLKQGGLMKIGLYSELARKHIITLREEIQRLGIESSDLAMKSFRRSVISSNKDHHQWLLKVGDFYTMSMMRDLLFHVQEHRFTVPQIQHSLFQLGLQFCGFEAGKMLMDFKQTNTGLNDPYNLDKWRAYEEANPNVFIGMYQFWCQKTA